MRCAALIVSLFLFAGFVGASAQSPQDISVAQLDRVMQLPLTQAVKQREIYKVPLKAAYERQMGLVGKDCSAESVQGQQPYNICMGYATEQADRDFATFYNNLQMLCHDQDQLAALQSSRRAWESYRDSAMKAAQAAWSEGTGAPGFASEVYLSLLRNYMQELDEIYGLNIAQ